MTTQYTVDLGAAAGFDPAQTQALLNILNPSLGSLSSEALEAFEQQLAELGTGKVGINSVTLDSASTPSHPFFDLNVTGRPNEALHAGAGHDVITGAAGDTLYGSTSATGGALLVAGSGNEVLYAGAGSDTLEAGSGLGGGRGAHEGGHGRREDGDDRHEGRHGRHEDRDDRHEGRFGLGGSLRDPDLDRDTMGGGHGNVTMYGSTSPTGHALMIGGTGNSVLYGGAGSDTMYGGTGRSTINAGYGHETMYGGSGPTTFVVDKAHFVNGDVIHGGTGASILDLADFNASDVTVNKNAHTGVTTVAFNGSEIKLTDVTGIEFKNGPVHKL